MFNGLIREIAEVISFSGNFLNLKAKYRPDLGDSISVNGACLSVVKLFNDGFCVELSAETRKILALENFKNRVHIEPAMCLGDRIDGHLLQGHIDFIGSITKINKNENGTDFFVRLTPEAMKFVANKGSIGIDGISLTINEIMDQINEIRLTKKLYALQSSWLLAAFLSSRSRHGQKILQTIPKRWKRWIR